MWESSAAQAHYMNQQQVPPMENRGQPPPQHYQPPQHMQQPQQAPPQHGAGGVPVHQQQQQHVVSPHRYHPSPAVVATTKGGKYSQSGASWSVNGGGVMAPRKVMQPQQPPMVAQAHAHPQQKPRGKMTPYACFVKVIRAEHKKKHPNESIVFSEFSKKCAEKWRQMTDKEKRRFQEMAEKDKERYENEMQHYQPPDGQPKGRVKKRKKPKDPDAPKRALSAFMWFCKDFRHEVKEKNPEMRMGDIAKVLSERWKVAVNKEFYESRANEDKSRYADAMKIFRATKGVGPHGGKVTNAQARAALPHLQLHQAQQAQIALQQAQAQAVAQHQQQQGLMGLPNPTQPLGLPPQGAVSVAPGHLPPVQGDPSVPPPEKKSRRESTSSSSGSGSSSDSSSDSEGEQECDE